MKFDCARANTALILHLIGSPAPLTLAEVYLKTIPTNHPVNRTVKQATEQHNMSKTQEQTTEESILAAAKRVFLRKGYSGARMQEVADEAKINKAMLHYYFRSKDRLFNVILAQSMDRLSPLIFRSLAEPGLTVVEKLELVSERHMQLIFEEPHLPLFIIHELAQRKDAFIEELSARGDTAAMLGFFQQVVEEGEAGTIRKVNPIHLILNAISVTVFPFIVGPLIQTMSGISEEAYQHILAERKQEVKKVIRAITQP
jgi:AcrR family transcriptional regulator